MYYCEKCMLLSQEDVCPACGGRDLKAPEDGDFCFLTEKETIWAGMLEDVLNQKNIPFTNKPVLGAGLAMRTGPAFERYRFYVPFSHISNAKEIVDELFGETSK